MPSRAIEPFLPSLGLSFHSTFASELPGLPVSETESVSSRSGPGWNGFEASERDSGIAGSSSEAARTSFGGSEGSAKQQSKSLINVNMIDA